MIDKTQLKGGIIQYTYWEDTSNSPLGILWVIFAKGQTGKRIAFLLNAMTAHWARRKGICTELHSAVNNDADLMISPSGSEEGGAEFLKKYGFVFNENLDMWVYPG
jgi:hypothetical protein